jgi:hypothetical protein
MAAPSREDVMAALTSLIAAAYPWKLGPARRLRLWSDVPSVNRPACFLFEGGEERHSWSASAIPKRVLEIRLFIYLNAKDQNVNGASLINDVLDALERAFTLSSSDLCTGRNTLDGLVHHCRIDGKILKDPGDLDGDALVIVPIEVVLP